MAGLEEKAVRHSIEGALVRRGLGVMERVFQVDGAAREAAEAAHTAFEEQTERNFLRACNWHAKSEPPLFLFI
jgi:predicted nuclease with TOPRIM domain